MAKRPIIEKKVNAMKRALRKGRLPACIDLVDWLIERGHAQTVGAAHKLIMAERVKVDSHPIGVHTLTLPGPDGEPKPTKMVYCRVPADMRDRLTVEAA